MLDVAYFVLFVSTRGFHNHRIVYVFADECSGNWRHYRNFSLLEISFVFANDLIADAFVGYGVVEHYRNAEDNFIALGNTCDVDDLGIGQTAFDFLNSPFVKALLFARRVILGVFF